MRRSIKVLSSADRARWITRDPEGYFAFVRKEAAMIARRRRGIPDRWAAEPSDLDALPSGGRHVAKAPTRRARFVVLLKRLRAWRRSRTVGDLEKL